MDILNKSIKLINLFLLIYFSLIIHIGCDDAGVTVNNNLAFTFSGLKHLDPQKDGVYEAWIAFAYTPTIFVSCGKFNVIDATGQIVDTTGNPIILKLKYRPYNFNSAKYSLITIDPPDYIDSIPPQVKLLGGDVSVINDTLTTTLNTQNSHAIGEIINNFENSNVNFMLFTPTDSSLTNWFNGIWFCNTDSTSSIFGLNVIPDSIPWIYQAWIYNTTDNSFIKIGYFKNPYATDDDGAGPYAFPKQAYNKPGQDWVTNLPLPINDLRNYYYRLLITIEPISYPNGLSTHFLQLFFGGIPPEINVGQNVSVDNVSSSLPTATMKIVLPQ